MRSSLTRNYIYNLGYQMLVLIVPIVTMPYISRVLGDENIGVFNFLQSIVGYFVLFGCIGLNLYGQREIAACGDDVGKRSKVFFELQLIRVITVGAALLIYSACTLLLVKNLGIYYWLFGIEILASIFDISWFYQGIEYFKIQAVRNLIIKTLGVTSVFLFVKSESDLWIYIVAYTASILIGNLTMWFCLGRYMTRISFSNLRLMRHVKPALIVFFPQIATSIYCQLDKTMIKFLADYSEVAFYSQAEKIVKIVLTVVTAMGLVMLSRVAASYSNKEDDKIKQYITNSFRYLYLLMWPCMFGLMAITKNFVPWFFGPGYERVVPCMIMLCPIIVLIGLSNTLGTQYLLPTNQMKYYTVSVIAGAVVNLILNFLLIGKFGCVGAAVATIFAELTVTAVQFWYSRDKFKVSVLLLGWKSFLAAAIMGLGVWFVSGKVNATFAGTLTEIGVGAAIYLAMLLVLRDEFFFKMVKRLLRKE